MLVADNLDGGLGFAIANGSRWLESAGWDVAVVAPPPNAAAVVVRGTFIPVEVPGSARNVAGMLRAARQIRRVVAAQRPDVVHCHGLRSFLLTSVLGRRRVLLTLHIWLTAGVVPDDPPGYHLIRRAAVAVLPRLALRAFSVAPGLEPRYAFTPHASPLLATLDGVEAFAAGAPFLWLARLDVPKQPEELVHAATAAAEVEPSVRVVVAGGGTKAPDVDDLVRRLDAPVTLLGERDDVASLLAGARAVVHVSGAEGVPLALVEAMWAGRAVVASRLPGTEWLSGGEGHGVTLVDDRDDLVRALVRLSDDEVAAAEGIAAAERIRSILGPDSPWPDVERAYREVLGRG